jgi:hypothetical protein
MTARKSRTHQRPSLGRLGWLVIRTFHSSLLIGADLYLAGPPVESVRHGGADGRDFIPESDRHSGRDDDSSRDDGNSHGVVHLANMRLWRPGSNRFDPLPAVFNRALLFFVVAESAEERF